MPQVMIISDGQSTTRLISVPLFLMQLPGKNIMPEALRFRSDLSLLIEQNRRRSSGYAEDFVIEGVIKVA